MGKAVLGERRRSNQAHENKSLCILRLCIARWKDARKNTRHCGELDGICGEPMEFE